ncbi:hypothetical protein OKW21_002456 [Catalinimonas alkaloidigena]|uniref:hypothetical protein n=1 Tax=Catalinimonas alkaloidigena TaxID=1075417 RepID=UPI0024071727|nr:hypothetical protein [Catalinimonas alkaloidigena]MDF9797193.1 hypothetical protein [Catalinimonas alkaloidigena]
MKNESKVFYQLLRLRYALSIITIFALFFPFIMQQTFFPFFRFGMFAEPVTRKIQTETFHLIGVNEKGMVEKQLGEKVGVDQSKLNYLLRNYYYRGEADKFTKQFYQLLPEDLHVDTVLVLRSMLNDSSIIARYPNGKGSPK